MAQSLAYFEEISTTMEPYKWYPQRAGRVDLILERARATGEINDPVLRQEIAKVLARSKAAEWTARRARTAQEQGLLHATARDAAGAARPLPYGGKALGRLTLTADGRMMSVVCDGRTELPAGVRREYSSYCGNYTYDGERLRVRSSARSRR
jgi:hypothetical protein